jgi:elongation factor 3
MSPVAAMEPPTSLTFAAHLDSLKTAPTAPDAKAAADTLARAVKKAGLASLV